MSNSHLETLLAAMAARAKADVELRVAQLRFLTEAGYQHAYPGWNAPPSASPRAMAMTSAEAVANELKILGVATHCHGYGGKCPREVTVYRGKARFCSRCDGEQPERLPLPRTADPEGLARAKLTIRDYDDPHNTVARNAPH